MIFHKRTIKFKEADIALKKLRFWIRAKSFATDDVTIDITTKHLNLPCTSRLSRYAKQEQVSATARSS